MSSNVITIPGLQVEEKPWEALIIRIQLMHSHNDFVFPQVFNRLFTMHGTTMIIFVDVRFLCR